MTNICSYFNPCSDFHAIEDFKDLPCKEKAGIAFITMLIACTIILIPLVIPVFRYLVGRCSENPIPTPTIAKTRNAFRKKAIQTPRLSATNQAKETTKRRINIDEVSSSRTAPQETQVSIEVWNPKKRQEDSGRVYRHLDIGSSNYGPESSQSGEYRHAASDTTGEKIHRVLFDNLDHVIGSHTSYKEFVFYLNDISSEGLDKAALNLAKHLRQKHKNEILKIKIVKIVADIFKLNPIPTVDSASFIHPFDLFYARIFLNYAAESRNHVTKKAITDLFLKVTNASKTGLLIKESNMDYDTILDANLSVSASPTYLGLKFEKTDTSFIPLYMFPSGAEQDNFSLSYLVTRIA